VIACTRTHHPHTENHAVVNRSVARVEPIRERILDFLKPRILLKCFKSFSGFSSLLSVSILVVVGGN